jgi:hypothetical protein
MVQLGPRGTLDCISNLSLGWKAHRVGLHAGHQQKWVQAVRKRSAIVSDDTSSFMHSKYRTKFVVHSSGSHTVLIGSTRKRAAMIGGPRG